MLTGNNSLRVVPGSGVIVDTERNHYILNVQSRPILGKIKDHFPVCFSHPYKTGELVVLPVHPDTIRLLENLKLPTKGMEPFHWQYAVPMIEGKYKAMAHQVTSAAFMAEHPRCYNFSEMRTGKTVSTILGIDYLQRFGRVRGACLIIATVSTLTGVWKLSIESTLPDKTVVVVHGGTGKRDREKELAKAADYYVINYDGVKMVRDELAQMAKDGVIGMVVVDELTHYGNPSSQRFKALDYVVNKHSRVEYVWGLTGSPGNNPVPIFGFASLINPDRLPCKSLRTWQDLTMYKYGTETWMWKNKPDAPKILHNVLQPAIRFNKRDVMDLPPVVRQRRSAPLSKEQKRFYSQMKEHMLVLMESGEMLEAVHKASLTQKLFQISQGAVRGTVQDSEESSRKAPIYYLDSAPRLEVLKEVIAEATRKVVIFCPYTAVIDKLKKDLQDKYTVDVVDGRVTGKARARIFEAFQAKKDPHILICHPQTTAFGVELSAADTIIFNGPPLNGDFIYSQALERLSSLKQKADQVSVVQLYATDEEYKFFQGLDDGVKSSELVNKLFSELKKNSQ